MKVTGLKNHAALRKSSKRAAKPSTHATHGKRVANAKREAGLDKPERDIYDGPSSIPWYESRSQEQNPIAGAVSMWAHLFGG